MNPTSPPIRLLLVDDHAIVRLGLRALLAAFPDLEIVAEAEDAASALTEWRKHKPDVTLMDVRLPGESGVAALALIRAEFPAARVLMLTTYDQEEDIYRAAKAGAAGYLLKDVKPADLAEAIRAVRAGGDWFPPAIARKLQERSVTPTLSPRELEVLALVAKGLSNREIARILEISEHTIKIHVRHLLEKIGASDRTEAVAEALRRGLVPM